MRYVIGFGLLMLCGAASAEPLSTAAAAFTALSSGAGLAGMGAGLLGAKLLGKKSSTPAAATPAVMPVSDDKSVQEARRRQIAAMQSGAGRASTILSDGGAKLGG